jgi:hypothetical protein
MKPTEIQTAANKIKGPLKMRIRLQPGGDDYVDVSLVKSDFIAAMKEKFGKTETGWTVFENGYVYRNEDLK